jgi:hypothetical protein
MFSPVTARKWATRYRVEGAEGMVDRCSRPWSIPTERRRRSSNESSGCDGSDGSGPCRSAASWACRHRRWTRCSCARISRLSHIDRVTSEPIRLYEHPHPASLIHVQVTKFGNIPERCGPKFLTRQQSKANARDQAVRTRGTRPPIPPADRYALPTSRSAPTISPLPRSACSNAQSSGSPTAASPSSA